MIGSSDDETSFPHKLLLTNRQVGDLRKVFSNNSSVHIKLSKNQLSNIVQSEGLLGRIFVPLLKRGLLLMKNVFQPLISYKYFNIIITAAASQQTQEYIKKSLRFRIL